eukprot:7605771-Pyramimonas_sp.AAC.1
MRPPLPRRVSRRRSAMLQIVLFYFFKNFVNGRSVLDGFYNVSSAAVGQWPVRRRHHLHIQPLSVKKGAPLRGSPMRSGRSRSSATPPSVTGSWASRRRTASTCQSMDQSQRTQLGGRAFSHRILLLRVVRRMSPEI